MAKQPGSTATPTKKSGPNRNRRNALERKCLSKASKRLYQNAAGGIFKQVLTAERDARKKAPISLAVL